MLASSWASIASYAEDQLGPATLVDGTIANQPQVDVKFRAVFVDVAPQVGRPLLFLSFKEEHEVRGRLDSRIVQSIECGEQGPD
jgi:hypothetical protein